MVFHSHEKHESMLWSLLGRPAGRVSVCGKSFNVAIFSDTRNMINVKLCMMVVLVEFYLFIPLLVTWIVFQSHSGVKQFNWTFHLLIRFSWNFVRLLIKSGRSWIYHYFWFSHMLKGDNCQIFSFERNFSIAFFSDTVKTRSFRLCMMIILFGVYIFGSGLMAFVSKSQVCRKYKLQIVLLDSCLDSCQL